MRKFLKILELKISPMWKRKQSIKFKRQKESPKTHINQTKKTKHKERILKTAREKQQVTYKGNPIGLTADVSAKTLQATRK